jgi:hypothetical protein
VRRLRVLVPAALVVFFLLGEVGNGVAEPAPYVVFHPFTFERSHGWMQVASSFHNQVGDGTVFHSTWAASVPISHTDLERATREGIGSHSIPVDTLRSLPPDAIVILVSSNPRPPSEQANVAWWPTRRPSAVVRAGVDDTWGDDLGIPGASLVSLRGVVHGYISEAGAWVEASVWFGSPTPSLQTLSSANAELNRLNIIYC